MALNDSDKLLVNDGSKTETITFANFKNGTMLSNTDKFLVNDGAKTETITWAEIQDELGEPAPVLDSVVLSQDAPIDANRFTGKSFTSTTANSGGDATTLEMTSTVTGALGIKAGSDPITTNAYPGTSSTDVVLTLEGETNLTDVIQIGDTVTANVSYTPETDTISSVTPFTANTSFGGNAAMYTSTSSSVDSRDNFKTQTAVQKNALNTAGTLLTAMGGSSGSISFDPPLPGPVTVSYRVVGNIQLDNGVTFTDGNNVSDPGGDRANVTYDKTLDDGLKSVSFRTSKTPESSSYNMKYIYYIESNGSRVVFNDAGNTLTLPTEKDIALFQVDDIVQGTDVKVTATDVSAKTITVDGGSWTAGTDKVSTISAKQGSGTVSDITNAQVTISPFTDNCFKEGQYLTVNKTIDVDPKTDKITSYDDSTKVITVDGQTDLAQFADGDDVFMTDNSGSGASTKTGYKLTTTDIESVSGTAPSITLTFPGAASTNPDLKYFKPNDIIQSTDVKVVSVDTINNTMTVDGGTWAQGDKVEYQTTGGVGTIAAGGISFTNKTITLTASEVGDARWIADNTAGTEFRVATATKPAVATTAYLTFSADGAVTGYQATPVEPRAMNNKIEPRLTFPATFPDTGTAPDTEFPGTDTYIQTSVQLKNDAGNSATVKSNNLVPQTNIRSVVAACQCENNAEEIKAMGMQIATHDQRVADHTAAMRQEKVDQLEASLRRYSS